MCRAHSKMGVQLPRLLVPATEKSLYPALHPSHICCPLVAAWIDDESFRLGTGGVVYSIGIYATVIWRPAHYVSFVS